MNMKDVEQLDYTGLAKPLTISNELEEFISYYKPEICNDSKFFMGQVGKCNNEQKYGKHVTAKDIELLDSFTKIIIDNGNAGICVNGGTISTMYKTKECKYSKILEVLLILAFTYGGTKCDCYDNSKVQPSNEFFDRLCSIGFIPVSQTNFDSNFSDVKDANKVVFFARNVNHIDSIITEQKSFSDYTVKEFETYDKAYIYRDKILKEMQHKEHKNGLNLLKNYKRNWNTKCDIVKNRYRKGIR